MKTSLILLLFLAVIFSSCEEGDVPSSDHSTTLIGKWELRWSKGGMFPNTSYGRGNGNIIEFTTSDYKRYQGEVLKYTDPYAEGKEIAPVQVNHDFVDRYIKWQTVKEYYRIKNDTLKLYLGVIAADGTERAFVRK